MSLVEVEFKGRRKGIYSNPQEFPLRLNEYVIVRADRGENMGRVSLLDVERDSELLNDKNPEEFEPVLRRACKDDFRKQKENEALEKQSRSVFIDFIHKHELVMKLVDAEYQLDHRKLTFYFTADGRVDFRMLVKDLAHHFKTRIDLRQIGARDEAKRLGGIGICGRVLCCATWIREFQPVTTNMVKEQNLLLNPQKNTGLCGRLRCCLRYEVDQYREVNRKFPKVDTRVQGPRGEGTVEKVDMCSCSCGIHWRDGAQVSFSLEQMLELSDWNPETLNLKQHITFHTDPSLEEERAGKLVASAEPGTDERDPDSSSSADFASGKPAGSGRKVSAGKRQKSGKKAGKGGRKTVVEAVPVSRSDDNEDDSLASVKTGSAGAGGNPPKKSRRGNPFSKMRSGKRKPSQAKKSRNQAGSSASAGTDEKRPHDSKTENSPVEPREKKKSSRSGRKRKR